MTPPETAELLDLRGQPVPEQMQEAQSAIERASEHPVTVLTDVEVLPKFLLPASAERGLRCRLEPPADGDWRITLGSITNAGTTERGGSL